MSTHLSQGPTRNTSTTSTTPTATTTIGKTATPLSSDSTKGDSDINKIYPTPEATYEEVVQNACLFTKTLQDLHRSFGTKFMVPTIGGKALDIHRLFVEVTFRGGLEKIIRDRKWREVINVFNFPSTITNASFVLRKYYISLLHRYEEVYYFRKQGPRLSTSASVTKNSESGSITLQTQSATPTHEKGSNVEQLQSSVTKSPNSGSIASQAQAATLTHENGSNVEQLQSSPQLHRGCWVSGTIDGKFDNGYLVTVSFGSDKLKGVLYHVPLELQVSQSSNTAVVPRRRDRKRSRLALKDPSHPKPNRSGYNFFFSEHYAKLKPSHHGEEKVISKKIGHLWSKLTEAEKQVYQDKGLRDKERYQNEMLEYRKSGSSSKQ